MRTLRSDMMSGGGEDGAVAALSAKEGLRVSEVRKQMLKRPH